MVTERPWHPVPGRLQAVSVANRSQIWGITLDYQLCKFNSTTRKWQLVSVLPEVVNNTRYSSSSSISPDSPRPSSLGQSQPFRLSNQYGGHQRQDSNIDPDCEITIQVAASSDGTVVRLDQTRRAWFMITPSDTVDFEKDVIWIDLEHFWKCVSVASMSQIWGLAETGDIFYGSSDRFVELDSVVSGNARPQFTHISVGQDNVVIATDAHTGTAFRLFTDASSPIWRALPGTGSHAGLHLIQCCLSNIDYIVGLDEHGRVLQLVEDQWQCLGETDGEVCNTVFVCVDVGNDGYVVAVDKGGDLHGCQLDPYHDSAAPPFSNMKSELPEQENPSGALDTTPLAAATITKPIQASRRRRTSSTSYHKRMEALPTPSITTSITTSRIPRARENFYSGYGDAVVDTTAALAKDGLTNQQQQPNPVTAQLSQPSPTSTTLQRQRTQQAARQLFEGSPILATAKRAASNPATPSSATNNNGMSSSLSTSLPRSVRPSRTSSQSSYADDFGHSLKRQGSSAALAAATATLAAARSATPTSVVATTPTTNTSPLRIRTKVDPSGDRGNSTGADENDRLSSKPTQRRSNNSEGMSNFSPAGLLSPRYSSDDLATPSPFPGYEEILPAQQYQQQQQQRQQKHQQSYELLPVLNKSDDHSRSSPVSATSPKVPPKSILRSATVVDNPLYGVSYATNPRAKGASTLEQEKEEINTESLAQGSNGQVSQTYTVQDPYIQTCGVGSSSPSTIDMTTAALASHPFVATATAEGGEGGWGQKDEYSPRQALPPNQSQFLPQSQSPSFGVSSSPLGKSNGWNYASPTRPMAVTRPSDKTELYEMNSTENYALKQEGQQQHAYMAEEYSTRQRGQVGGEDNTEEICQEPPPPLRDLDGAGFQQRGQRMSQCSALTEADPWLEEQQEYLKMTSLHTRDSNHAPVPLQSDFVPKETPLAAFNSFQQQYNPSQSSLGPYADVQMQQDILPQGQQQQHSQQQQTSSPQPQRPTPVRPFPLADESEHMGRPSYSSSHLQHYLDTTLKNEYSNPSSPLSPSSGRRLDGVGPSSRPSSPATPVNPYGHHNLGAGSSNNQTGPAGTWGRTTGATMTTATAAATSTTLTRGPSSSRGSGAGSRTGSGIGRTATQTPPTPGTVTSNGSVPGLGLGVTSAGVAKSPTIPKTTTPPPRRQSGIQGEDEQGRWIERPTDSNPRVVQWDPDHHKSKCCTIL
ncbi:hypothetical protein BGW41_007997 [Actinomortierella wolfii]|nr:hypothetical protein BGW41_007997 [Actinomortierella wolfii]